jgi:hypothetical protein
MSVYEIAKDALTIAQKLDNIDLVNKLMEVQSQALEMQSNQLKLQEEISKLKNQVAALKESKKFIYSDGNHLIDPNSPDRHLCPICTRKNGFEMPLDDGDYCHICERTFE